MSHRPQPAQILREPCHPEVRRGVRPAFNEPCHVELPRDVRSAYNYPASSIRHPASPRSGLTLIEMLVALAVTLVMMAAVVNLFANISGSIRNRRAVIEVSGQLRQVRSRLALDLAGATCPGTTWQRPDEDVGYIEIIEGQYNDSYPSILVDGVLPPTAANPELDYTTSLVPSGGDPLIDLSATVPPLTDRAPQPGDVTNGRALGDWDDILALTVRSESEPFVTYVGSERVESNLAEVIWFAGENTPGVDPGEPGMRRIYRNVLLISPGRTWPNGPGSRPPFAISMHYDGTQWVSNTLGDLTKREYRAARDFDDEDAWFPHLLDDDDLSRDQQYLVLDSALAFDVRVYDPGAPLYAAPGNNVVQPGDPGWYGLASGPPVPTPVGYGAYCDLGWNWDPVANAPYVTALAGQPHFPIARRAGWHPSFLALAPQPLMGFPAVYDSWSFHYENDRVNQEQILIDWAAQESISPPPQFADWQINTLDQGANGLDDDNINGVDDLGERETAPPYDFPLRGVKVSLRIYERDARQIRETSVTHAFSP